MFSKNIRTVYLYTVCFITLMMVIGGIISTVNAVASYCLPMEYVSYIYPEKAYYEGAGSAEESAADVEIREKEEARMAAERVIQQENERIRNIRSIFNSCAVWLIALPIFILHSRKTSKEEAV